MTTPIQIQAVTPYECFRLLGISRTLGYAKIKDGSIPSTKISPRKILVPLAGIAKILGADSSTPT